MKANPGHGLIVCAQQCDQCLFSPGKIVSDERRREILARIAREDAHFECHKATQGGRHAACAGDFKRDPLRTSGMRIAHALNAVILVDENGEVVS